MVYNEREIIERIFDEIESIRKKENIKSLDAFIEKYDIGYTREALYKLKREQRIPDIHALMAFCKAFDCELGYLLGEYEEKTRNHNITKTYALLSSSAINYLEKHGSDTIIENPLTDILNGYDTPPKNKQYIHSLNTILETYPELIVYIGRFLLHEELNLSTNGMEIHNKKKINYNIDEATLNLALQLKTFITKGEKIKTTNIHNSTRHRFALNFIASRLEDLEAQNAELFNTLFSRP